MGWWKLRGSDDVVGDLPLDVLGIAVRDVVLAYQQSFNRRPTLVEWEHLLRIALGHEEPALRASDTVVRRVTVHGDVQAE